MVTSIRPLALLVQDLASEWADVTVVVPPNADPHSMSLKPSMRVMLDRADLVVWLGPEFERFLAKPMVLRKTGVDLAVGSVDGLLVSGEGEHEHEHEHEHDEDHDGYDMDLHVWLSPSNAESILRALSVRLILLRPDLEGVVNTRLAQLIKEIEQARLSVKDRLRPFRNQGFGVYHNAYGYFAKEFQLRVISSVYQVPEQRLSAKHLHQLQQDMASASCIVVERKTEKTDKLVAVLKVKQVEADPLASNKNITSYMDFLLYLGGAFESCFKQ